MHSRHCFKYFTHFSQQPHKVRTFFFFFNLFIYFWLCWVFVSVRGLSLVVPSGATLHRGARASHYRGLSCWRSTGSRRAGSVIAAHGPSCSAACGIFPDQGTNPHPLHWQADSQPLRHQGSLVRTINISILKMGKMGQRGLITPKSHSKLSGGKGI